MTQFGQYPRPLHTIAHISDTHFLGGGRHFGSWEVADIGVLIQFRRAGKLIKSKVILLQSKRLYPSEEDYAEDERVDYQIGFARLFHGDGHFPSITAPRVFAFGDGSKYQALRVKDAQYVAIKSYEEQHGIPVYYMLYHPALVPCAVEVPIIGTIADGDHVQTGARVLPARDLRAAMDDNAEGYSPRYGELRALPLQHPVDGSTGPGWLVEHFIADLALDCKVGHIALKESDPGLFRVFNLRSGPISAAIAITFDAPPGSDIG
jgi:hypothetical protein